MLQPALHPAHRSTQLNPGGAVNGPALAQARHDVQVHGPIALLNATLEPGDLLFVPAMWFHHVTALTPALSLNVWTGYKATAYADQAAAVGSALLGNGGHDIPRPERVQALRALIGLLLDDLKLQLTYAGADQEEEEEEASVLAGLDEEARRLRELGLILTRTRYQNIGRVAAVQPEFCNDDQAFAAFLNRGGFYLQAIQSALRAIVPSLQEVRAAVGGLCRASTPPPTSPYPPFPG